MSAADSDDDGDGLSAPQYDIPSASSMDGPEGQLVISAVAEAGAEAPRAQPRAAAPQPQSSSAAAPQAQPPQQQRQIDPASIKHWIAVYPRYLEEGLTLRQGRRLPKSQVAGCA